MDFGISITIIEEIRLFASAFFLGVALMIFYDIIRIFRILIPQGVVIVAVEDLLFWLIASIAIFILLFLLNLGRVRFYALGMVGLGMLLEYRLIGRRWPRYIRKRQTKKEKYTKKQAKSSETID